MAGPLEGLRIVELAGIGAAPFACMMFADHGAEVIRIDRPGADVAAVDNMRKDVLLRSRRVVAADLKSQEGRRIAIDLIRSADGLVEGFRPGVAEKLGLGPDQMLEINPSLVYGRITGWGQDGPNALRAGHDINYLALSGALHTFGRDGEKPTPPINIVGTFGGALMLAFAMTAAMLHARNGGTGQVIDCATTESSALLVSVVRTMMAQGRWEDRRGVNMIDTGAHFYETYETLDGQYVAVGAVEPQFYATLCGVLGLEHRCPGDQMDQSAWRPAKAELTGIFRQRTRTEWCTLFEGVDACVTPVLSMAEAPADAHNIARGSFVEAGGVIQSRPVPRYSKTPNAEPVMWGGNYHTIPPQRTSGQKRNDLHAAE